jgi:hypothetical protein
MFRFARAERIGFQTSRRKWPLRMGPPLRLGDANLVDVASGDLKHARRESK